MLLLRSTFLPQSEYLAISTELPMHPLTILPDTNVGGMHNVGGGILLSTLILELQHQQFCCTCVLVLPNT